MIDDFPNWVLLSISFVSKNEMPHNFHSASLTGLSQNQRKFQKYILIASMQ